MNAIARAQAAITTQPLSDVYAIVAGSRSDLAPTLPAAPMPPSEKRAKKQRHSRNRARRRVEVAASLIQNGWTPNRDTRPSPAPVFDTDDSCCAGKFFHTNECPTQKGVR